MRCENQEFSAPTEGEIGNLGQYQSERDRKTWGGGGIFKTKMPVNVTKNDQMDFLVQNGTLLFCLFSIRYIVITD